MDAETVFRIIDMLDKQRDELKGWHDASLDWDHYDNRYKHQMQILHDFRVKLQMYIDRQVAHMETEQGM